MRNTKSMYYDYVFKKFNGNIYLYILNLYGYTITFSSNNAITFVNIPFDHKRLKMNIFSNS